MSETPTKSWLPLWLALSITWGFSFLFIKVAGEFLDPFQQTFARIALGFIALAIYVALSNRKFIIDFHSAKHLAILGLLGQTLPFTIFAWAEHHISSIAAGLVNSMTALWTALFAIVLLPEEKLNRSKSVGIVIGFGGILILLGIWDADFKGTWYAYVGCSMATVCYAIASLYTRRKVSPLKLDPISAITTQLFFATIPLGITSLTTTSMPTQISGNAIFSVLMLGVFGTGIALVLNFTLIHKAGAVATSTVTYSIPIVATIAGVVFLREQLHWYEPIGALVALLGIALTQGLVKPNFLKTN